MKQLSLFLTLMLLIHTCCANEDSKLRTIIQRSAITELPYAIEQELNVSWYGTIRQDQDGKTPLHYLLERVLHCTQVSRDCSDRIESSLKLLIDKDADPYLEDKAGISPIALAQQYDNANDFCNLRRTLEDAFIAKFLKEMRSNCAPKIRKLTLKLLRDYRRGITALSTGDERALEKIMQE